AFVSHIGEQAHHAKGEDEHEAGALVEIGLNHARDDTRAHATNKLRFTKFKCAACRPSPLSRRRRVWRRWLRSPHPSASCPWAAGARKWRGTFCPPARP